MELFVAFFVTIIGIILGSFFACMGYRIPNKISTIKPRSFCPNCKKPLKWYMNIPIFSYIFLRGKCSYCQKKISFIYPLVEICSGTLFLLGYMTYGLSSDFLIIIILSSAFLITLVSDFLYYYISDRVVVLSLVLLIVISLLIYPNITTFNKIIMGIIMFIFMYIFKIIGDNIFKKESLGGGDIKILAVIGVSLGTSNIMYGIYLSFLSLILSSFLGLFFGIIACKKNKNGIVPFGPFLLLSTIIIYYLKDFLLILF